MTARSPMLAGALLAALFQSTRQPRDRAPGRADREGEPGTDCAGGARAPGLSRTHSSPGFVQAAWVGQSGLEGDQATPLFAHGLHGEGQTIAVLDTGADADSCWFYDADQGLPPINEGLGVGSPDPTQRKITIYNFLDPFEDPSDPIRWDSQGHGTHVAGSVSGDHTDSPGVRDSGDGQAPAAKLIIQDAGYAPDDCGDLPALGCPMTDLYPYFEQAFLQGARIHNNSYGDRESQLPYNIYSDGSEAADSFMWDHPEFLMVFAAGNNGPLAEGTVASPATAKNVLSIGATGNGTSANLWYGSSSVGPTHDDRIKPDLMAPGASVSSAQNDMDINSFNCDTRMMSGTSMASPTAAGYSALTREYYTKGYYPSGSATPGDSFTPSASLVKATMIASGTWMEHEEIDPLPAYEQGWGRILLDDALYFPGDDPRLWVTDVANRFDAPGEMDEYQVELLDGAKPLRVVLNWTDYPSNSAAAVNLVNDLDLEVVSPTSDVYKGNVFVDGLSQTGGARDDRNSTEGVKIADPEAGTWTIRVKAHAIPQATQGYALVVTGRTPAPGVAVERSDLFLDTSIAGNPGGILAPGGWVDAQVELWNTGGMTATNAHVTLESLTDNVVVERAEVSVGDIDPLQKESTGPLHLRFRIRPGAGCPEFFTLRFGYFADGWGSFEEETFGFGSNYLYTDGDTEDYYQLSVRENSGSSDVIEAAIDELAIWEPVCDPYDPAAAPLPVDDLMLEHNGTDVILDWSLPSMDPTTSEATRYKVYRSQMASGGFMLQEQVNDSSLELSWSDDDAVSGPDLLYYDVIAENDHGSSE